MDMTAMDAGASAGMQPPDMMEPPTGSSICIEIKCMGDGSFEVSSEPYQEEEAEPGEKPTGQPATTFGEALKLAVDMYKQSQVATPDQEMQAGYAS